MTKIKLNGCSPEDLKELLPDNIILLGYRGSIAHNMYVPQNDPNSIDDKDIMGVCFGPREIYLGLDSFEQREKKLREWDSVVYEFKKFIRLLKNGNPNVLSLLWLKEQHYIYRDTWGHQLIHNRDWFVSRKIYHSFVGYAYAQLKKMRPIQFEGYMGSKRKALVEKFGYDCKNAAHCIRLLRMGIEFLRERTLHVYREDSQQLLEIKKGFWTLDQVKQEADYQFKRIEKAYDECKLPNEVDHEKINELVMTMTWQWLNSSPIKERYT